MGRNQRIIIVPDNILAQIVSDRADPVDHHNVANGGASRQNLGELGGKGLIDDDDAIGGASDDIF